MSVAADRNLLFGILALQMDFVNRDQPPKLDPPLGATPSGL
jgi:hypothetical protein